MKKRSEKRQRTESFFIRLTPEEKQIIHRNARDTGYWTAGFMRQLGTGHQPQSIIDYKAIREIIHLRADLGRLAGLLKLWLGESSAAAGTARREINQVRDTMLANQKALRGLIDRIKQELGDERW